MQSDSQPGEIKSVLDALVSGKATHPAADGPLIMPVTSAVVQPAASGSSSSFTSGTPSNLSPSASSPTSLLDKFIPKISDDNAAKIDNHIVATQHQVNGAILDQQQVASKTMAALVAASGAAFCYPKTTADLHDAIENSDCTIVALNRQVDRWADLGRGHWRPRFAARSRGSTFLLHDHRSNEYKLEKEIIVKRTVIIIGNPLVMPRLDGGNNVRLFRGTRALIPSVDTTFCAERNNAHPNPH
jgi:hypothetical protein